MSGPHEKELSDLEKLLAALPPRPTTLDRDFLLFRAGQASMRRSWVWPFAAVVMSAAAGCLGMILVLQPVPEPVVRIVQVSMPSPSSLPPPAPGNSEPRETQPWFSGHHFDTPALSYWRMEQQALRFGVEGLPSSAYEGDENPTVPANKGREPSSGSRPALLNPSSIFSMGEP